MPERVDRSLFDLQRAFGEVSLNGKPARLDVAPGSGLAEVKAADGSDRMVLNWSIATTVMKRKKGAFVSRDRSDLTVQFNNPVANALRLLGVA